MSEAQGSPSEVVRGRSPSRVLTLGDGMIMVAVSCVGLALAVQWQRDLSSQLPTFFLSAISTATRSRVAGWAMSATVPATFGWLALRWRQPRPPLRKLGRQPGAVACIVASLMLVAQAACLPMAMKTMGGFTSPLVIAGWYWPDAIGSGVLASWTVLRLGGRWKSGDDWVDRTGMLIGACWLALPLALAVVEFS